LKNGGPLLKLHRLDQGENQDVGGIQVLRRDLAWD
jgi:hypothetical protein